MTSWAKPGAKIICIDGSPRHLISGEQKPLKGYPKKGSQYTIKDVLEGPWGRGTCITTRELPNIWIVDGVDYGWGSERFRPLITQQDDADIFRHLLSPSPLERLDLLAEILNELATD